MQAMITIERQEKKFTQLNCDDHAALACERTQLELLWSCAENRFNHDFKAFLALKVNHFRSAFLASRRESSRLHQTERFGANNGLSKPMFLNLPGLPVAMDESLMLDTPISNTSTNPTSLPIMDKAEKERLLSLHHEAASQTLDQAAQFGLRACRRIAAVIYKAYGGTGRLDLPGVRTGQVISTEEAAELITRQIDRQTFKVVLTSAAELAQLVGNDRHWIRPELRKECIALALQRIIRELSSRM